MSPGGKRRLIRGGDQPPVSTSTPVMVRCGSLPLRMTQCFDRSVVGRHDSRGGGGGVLHSGAVKVSAVLVYVTRRRVDRPVSTVDVNGVLRLDRQAQSESGLPLGGGGGVSNRCFCGRRAGFCVPEWC